MSEIDPETERMTNVKDDVLKLISKGVKMTEAKTTIKKKYGGAILDKVDMNTIYSEVRNLRGELTSQQIGKIMEKANEIIVVPPSRKVIGTPTSSGIEAPTTPTKPPSVPTAVLSTPSSEPASHTLTDSIQKAMDLVTRGQEARTARAKASAEAKAKRQKERESMTAGRSLQMEGVTDAEESKVEGELQESKEGEAQIEAVTQTLPPPPPANNEESGKLDMRERERGEREAMDAEDAIERERREREGMGAEDVRVLDKDGKEIGRDKEVASGEGDQKDMDVEGEVGMDEMGETGADGRDDFLSPDELKTLEVKGFQWKTGDTKYFTRESRGKIGYGQGPENQVQPIEPFGVGAGLKPPPKDQERRTVFKQAEPGFEPFRGPHVLETEQPLDEGPAPGSGLGADIAPVAQKPFAKIEGRIIWIPFYAKSVMYFFTAKDYEELVSNVVEEGGELKLRAPDQGVFKNMQKTVDMVREGLQAYGLKRVVLRHESLVTRHAEWLELKQLMKAIARYQETTAGEYNTAGLFAGNLRDAIQKALTETLGKMGTRTTKRLARGLEGAQLGTQAGATSKRQRTQDDVSDFPAYNPFMVKDDGLQKVRETLPRFF